MREKNATVDPRTSAELKKRRKAWRGKKAGGDVLWLTFLLRQQRLRRGASAAIAAAAEAQEEGEQQEEADAGGGTH
jgi:hypothetical protein